MKKILLTLIAGLVLNGQLVAQTVIKDGDLQGGTTYNWTKDKVYLLDGFVFLESGGTLNIEKGTVIKAKAKSDISTGDPASALIICRGAKIMAEGTAEEPVIFTAEADDVDDPSDMLITDIGLWGGLVILGKASVRESGQTEGHIEGIPSGETRAVFGGTDDADNSGVLKYVSIRHPGNELAPGNELNGLTLGAVGSGTTIEYVEIFCSSDDGVEFFGGTVNVKHFVSAFCDDDGFDWDIGYRGKGQFWFVIQSPTGGDCGMELDGAIPDGETLWSKPTVYNITLIGQGKNNTTVKPNIAILMRDNTGGTIANSIVADYPNKAIEVEDLKASSGADSRKRLEDGDLKLMNNIFWNIGASTDITSIVNVTKDAEDVGGGFLYTHLAANGDLFINPEINHISHTDDQKLDPRVSASGAAYSNLAAYPSGDAFFDHASYKGAFGANNAWVMGWTSLDRNGYLDPKIPNSTSVKSSDMHGYGVQIYPNPANGSATLSISLERSELLTVELYDVTGKLVRSVANDRFTAGSSLVNIDIKGMQPGIYICKVTGENNTDAKRLIIK